MRRTCRFVWRWLTLPLVLATLASGVTWWATSPRPRAVFHTALGITLQEFSPDGAVLAMTRAGQLGRASDYVDFHDVTTGHFLSTVRPGNTRTQWDPVGNFYYWPTWSEGSADGRLTVQRFDPRTGVDETVLQLGPARFSDALLANDGSTLTFVLNADLPEASVEVWDLRQNRRRCTLPISSRKIAGLALSGDGQRVALGQIWKDDKSDIDEPCFLFLWDTATGQLLDKLGAVGVAYEPLGGATQLLTLIHMVANRSMEEDRTIRVERSVARSSWDRLAFSLVVSRAHKHPRLGQVEMYVHSFGSLEIRTENGRLGSTFWPGPEGSRVDGWDFRPGSDACAFSWSLQPTTPQWLEWLDGRLGASFGRWYRPSSGIVVYDMAKQRVVHRLARDDFRLSDHRIATSITNGSQKRIEIWAFPIAEQPAWPTWLAGTLGALAGLAWVRYRRRRRGSSIPT